MLKPLFAPHFEVLTVRERGWQGKANGELLRLAEREFDAFVTMDQNLEHQQNLQTLELGLVVLQASSNAYTVIAPLMPEVNQALHAIRPGDVIHVPARL